MSTLFTIGHGTKTTDGLIETLRSSGIELLVDVRRFPGSKRHPHLGRASLEIDLPAAGIGYEWWGEELGGRRSGADASRHPAWRNAAFRAYADHTDTDVFREASLRLEKLASEVRVAVMCAETLWWRCHRRLIADEFVARGHQVIHIMGPGKEQPHQLNPAARIDVDGWLVYDVGTTKPLDL